MAATHSMAATYLSQASLPRRGQNSPKQQHQLGLLKKIHQGMSFMTGGFFQGNVATSPKNNLKRHFGNMVPVSEECPPSPCLEIQGILPECLDGGLYVRNGPNLKFFTSESRYNRFDGDGMMHSVKFHNGTASYCCRFVRTSRFVQEEAAGRKLFPNIFTELKGFSGVRTLVKFILDCGLGSIDLTKGIGTASSGVFFFNGSLFATLEADKPHVIRITEDGDLETLGRYDFGGKLCFSMAESPRIDPVSGEMFTFCYKKLLPPYLVYYRATSDGTMVSLKVKTKEPVMIHDLLITNRYTILPENQLVFRMSNMLKGELPFCLDVNRVTRVGVLPKYATEDSQVRWFQVPNLMCMHYTNAWEEGEDEVVLLGASIMNPENLLVDPENIQCQLTEIRICLTTGEAHRNYLSRINGEAYQINGRCTGRQSRYIFLASGSWPRFDGVYKLDLHKLKDGSSDGIVAHRKFPKGQYTSEITFVPKDDDQDSAEDDGYLLCYVHDELRDGNNSELLIMDAKSPLLDITATVGLPRRVPHGLHGIFITGEELSTQNLLPQVLPQHEHAPNVLQNLAGIMRFVAGA